MIATLGHDGFVTAISGRIDAANRLIQANSQMAKFADTATALRSDLDSLKAETQNDRFLKDGGSLLFKLEQLEGQLGAPSEN